MRAPPQAVVDVRSRAFARRENGSGHRSHGSAAGAGRCTSRMFAYITGARDSGRARGVFPRGVLREWRQLLDASPLPVLLALLRSPDDEAALGYIPSFCTACCRTGRDFMDLAKPGAIKEHCDPNALATFVEYLIDDGSAETRAAGERLVHEVLAEMDPVPQQMAANMVERVRAGKRDVFCRHRHRPRARGRRAAVPGLRAVQERTDPDHPRPRARPLDCEGTGAAPRRRCHGRERAGRREHLHRRVEGAGRRCTRWQESRTPRRFGVADSARSESGRRRIWRETGPPVRGTHREDDDV